MMGCGCVSDFALGFDKKASKYSLPRFASTKKTSKYSLPRFASPVYTGLGAPIQGDERALSPLLVAKMSIAITLVTRGTVHEERA